MDLEKLIDSFQTSGGPTHREELSEEKIVFIHDCFFRKRGDIFNFRDEEFSILNTLFPKTKLPEGSYQFVAAVKDFNITEGDLSTEDFHEHRQFLHEDIVSIDPTIIIPLGNLAFRMLTKKSGIGTKRGKEFVLTLEDKDYLVAPTLHPFSLYAEPKLRPLFIQDLDNIYDKFILNKNSFDDSPYELVNGDLKRFDVLFDGVMDSDVVSFDLETEGLDFKKDKILTFGISTGEKEAFVFPVHHKESEFTPKELEHIKSRCSELLASNKVVKVAHNIKFDLKFLMGWGLTDFNNVRDTQIMHSLVDENKPHGLMDLVKEYFPRELEMF